MFGRIRTCLRVSSNPLFIVRRLIQACNNVTEVRVKPSSSDQDCHKNDTYALLATLTIINITIALHYTAIQLQKPDKNIVQPVFCWKVFQNL